MKFTIYGLRERGSKEVRYIGFTRHTPETRLRGHLSCSTYSIDVWPLRAWLQAHRDTIEAFTIRTAKTEAEARAMEKGAIAACACAGQRLFNSDHVPRHVWKMEAA